MNWRKKLNDPAGLRELSQVARVSQIITFALITGVTIFALIVLWMRATGDAVERQSWTVTWAMLALAAAEIPPWLFVPRLITRSGVNAIAQGDKPLPASPQQPVMTTELGRLAGLYQTRMIVSEAMVEGAAFANLVAYLIEGHAISLMVAALALVGIALHFPTQPRMLRWAEGQLQRIDELRHEKKP